MWNNINYKLGSIQTYVYYLSKSMMNLFMAVLSPVIPDAVTKTKLIAIATHFEIIRYINY